MENKMYFATIFVVIGMLLFSGCQSSGAVDFERIDEENPHFYHITDNQFNMYSEKVQNAFQKTSTIIVTEHEIEDFFKYFHYSP